MPLFIARCRIEWAIFNPDTLHGLADSLDPPDPPLSSAGMAESTPAYLGFQICDKQGAVSIRLVLETPHTRNLARLT
jgi:hypothetical protein